MAAKVLYTGDLASLEQCFLSHLARSCSNNPIEPHVVLCGSHLLGTYLRRQAAQSGTNLFNVRFHTFDTLAADLLPADYRRKKLISPLGELVLLRSIVQSQRGYFDPVREKSGLLSALLAAVQDLIDGGVEEIPDAAQESGKLRDVARIYRSHRHAIAPFMSPSDMLRLAAESMPRFAAVFGTATLAVYGFYDFTFLQKEFLRAAAANLNLAAFVPYRPWGGYDFSETAVHFFAETGFVEITAEAAIEAPEATIERATGAASHPPSRRPEPAAGLRRLQERLFRNPAPGDPAAPPEPDGSVQIISAPDETGEITEICREIQSCARQGIDFSEMAVLLRNPDAYLPLILDLFPACAIPCYLQSGLPLARTQPARALMLLLELLDTDLPRFQVIEFASFAPLQWETLLGGAEVDLKEFRVSPYLWDRLSARAGVVSGYADWQVRLSRLSTEIQQRLPRPAAGGQAGPESGSAFHTRLELFQLKTLAAFIQTLDRWKKEFAACTTWSVFAACTGRALESFFGYGRPAARGDAAGAEPGENSAARPEAEESWRQLEEVIESVATLDQVSARVDLQEWISALRVTLENDRARASRFQDGGVNVLSVMGARGTRHRVVFVPGMTEKEIPVAGRQDAILLDRERDRINLASGGQLPLKLRRPLEEQLLFHLCAGAAREKLMLTYPRLDVQAGRARLPSHYLVRVAEALTGRPGDFRSLEELPQHSRRLLSQSAPEDPWQALTENQFALAFLKDPRQVPATLYHSRLRRSLEAYRARWSRRFTPFDGFLQSPDSLAFLAQWAGGQLFSPSALETLATCPFRFFLKRLLRLDAVEEPETIVRLSALDRGDLIHRILERFMRRAGERGWLPLAPERHRQLEALLETTARELFAEAHDRGITGYRLLWEMDSEEMLADLHTFLQGELQSERRFLPDRFEATFGWGDNPPLQLALPGGAALELGGRIDRVDVDSAGAAVRVVDYKTGRAPGGASAAFEGGKKLQLPIYLLAAAHLYRLPSLKGSLAMYSYVSSAGGFTTVSFSGEECETRRGELLELLQILHTALRQGLFPPTPAAQRRHCAWCDYRLVCDTAVERIYAFKSAAPQLEFQRRLEKYP